MFIRLKDLETSSLDSSPTEKGNLGTCDSVAKEITINIWEILVFGICQEWFSRMKSLVERMEVQLKRQRCAWAGVGTSSTLQGLEGIV